MKNFMRFTKILFEKFTVIIDIIYKNIAEKIYKRR